MDNKNKYSIISKDENETMLFGKKIADFFSAGDIIILDGDLGVGKTYFTKGFSEAKKTQNHVTSPTFSIANFYNSDNCTILHIDLYRLETMNELKNLGLEDYFDRSIVIVEWGMKFSEFFNDYLLIKIEGIPNGENSNIRKITVSADNNHYNNIIEKIKKIYA